MLLLVGRGCNGCFGGRRLYVVCDDEGPVQESICKSTLCSVLNNLLQIGQRIPGSKTRSVVGTCSTILCTISSCTCSPFCTVFSEPVVPTDDSFFVASCSNCGLQHQYIILYHKQGKSHLTDLKFSTNSATILFCLNPLSLIFVVLHAGQTLSTLKLRRMHNEQKVCKQLVITGAV